MVCANSGAHFDNDCEKVMALFDVVITSPSSMVGQQVTIDPDPQHAVDG